MSVVKTSTETYMARDRVAMKVCFLSGINSVEEPYAAKKQKT